MARRLFANDEKAKEISKRLESHSFLANEEGEEYTESTFGRFSDYFRRKKIKLQNRDAELRTAYSSSDAPKIFRGCVLTVQGYTNPNSSILHQLIVKHGGVFLDYAAGKTTVTHVIATNLPAKKRVEFAKYRVVKPDWILDSIEQGKLLEWTRYRVIHEKAGQARLGFGSGGPALVKTETPNKNTYKTPVSIVKTTKAVDLVRLPKFLGERLEIPASEGDEEDKEPPSHQPERRLVDEVDYENDGPPPSYQPRAIFDLPPSQQSGNEEPLEEVDLVAGRSFVSTVMTISFQESLLSSLGETVEATPEPYIPKKGVTVINGVEAYDAEAILDEKKHPAGAKPKNKKGKRKFLVKWKGYHEDEATWEWEDNLREDLDDDVLDGMILKYRRAKGLPEHPEQTPVVKGKRRRKSGMSSKGSRSTESSTRSKTENATIEETEGDNQHGARVFARDFANKEPVAPPRPNVSFILPESFSTINLSPDMADGHEPKSPPVHTEPDPSAQQPRTSISLEEDPPSSLPTPPKIDDPSYDQYEIPNSFSSVHISQISNWETADTEMPQPAPTSPSRATTPVKLLVTPAQTPVKKRPFQNDLSDFQTPPKKIKIADVGSLSPIRTAGRKPQTAEEYNAQLLANPRVRDATVLNPNFLTKFFQESRLHHLSTWKAELQTRMQALAQSSSPLAPSRLRQRRYVMHVDFDCFFAAVSIRDRPELKDKPVAICHGNSTNSTSSEIASCNYIARGFGIKNGSWLAAAKQLCPDLICLGYEFDKYEEASEAFYQVILAVGGERMQAVSVDEALVDISNLVCDEAMSDVTSEESKAAVIAKKVRDLCRERTGCEVSVGMGHNILIARLALRKAKPAGQHIVSSTDVESFLADLSISSFPGVGHHTSSKVSEKYGVDTVRDVRKITKEQLRQTLGPKNGDRLYELCRGIDNTQVGEGDAPRQSISVDVNWGVRFTDQHQAETFVMQLCEELERRMVAERFMGRNVTVKVMQRAKDVPFETTKFLGHGKCDTVSRSFEYKIPTREAKMVGRKVVDILRSCKISPGELRGIGLSFKGLERDHVNTGGQQTLKFAEAKERPVQRQPQEPEQASAQPMRVTNYVKPPVTTLMNAFAQRVAAKKEMETPRPPPATQYEIPSLSQIDLSSLENWPTPVREQIMKSINASPILVKPEAPKNPGRNKCRAENEESRRPSPQPKPSPSKNRQLLLSQSPRKNRVIPAPLLAAKKTRKPAAPPIFVRRKVFDRNGADVSDLLFTEAGIDEATFFALDKSHQLETIRHHQKEREKRQEAEAKVRNLERQRQARLETALRIPVKRRRPVWINSVLEIPLISSDPEAVKNGIRKWARPPKDHDEEEEEGPVPEDLEEWCEFLTDVVTVEMRPDKAAMYVRTLLFEAGERFGWGFACQKSVDAVNEAAKRGGKGEITF